MQPCPRAVGERKPVKNGGGGENRFILGDLGLFSFGNPFFFKQKARLDN